MSKFGKMWVISWVKENGMHGYARVCGSSYEDVLAEFLDNANTYSFVGMPEDVTIEYDGYENQCMPA